MNLKVITTDFDIFDKLSKINILNIIDFPNTPNNRKKLNRILNNINSKNYNIEVSIVNNMIRLEKKRKFNLNVYFKN